MDEEIVPEIDLLEDDGEVEECECGECDECIENECNCGECDECLEKAEELEDSFDDAEPEDLLF